ncbi:MAG TPA: DinB family protein [Gemmatimonadales bacterium]|nr:DinB family protein [Gemmatimonadales bacterium]
MSDFSNPAGAAGAAAGSYVRSLLALLGDRPPLEVLGELATWLPGRLRDVAPARLRQPEAPGKWSAVAVVVHLLDAEIEHGHRTRHIVGQDEPAVTGYDQDRWSREFAYEEADLDVTLAALLALRAANLRHWARLTPAQLERAMLHDERGRETAGHYLRLAAGHDLAHRRQLDRILGA